ncbi:MAG: sigma 54-interacting transcriptional regulator, partial [Bdellovibrionales bacterium]|nr:sigma 54-interacting transcriptional regulator [Bdellovibrionales bacterium]
ENWVHSLADPNSRELWMRWLPRYAAYTNENPIILGETGTGKTRLAHALHLLSNRSGPFVSITPRDFSSSELVQAELFGAVAGAYTGAVDKWGLVKSAEKGTLFIDELQSIDKDLQGKLITFIENKRYRRVGSADTTEADVRFVFATNQSIEDMVSSDTLREDFAYRLERVQLELRPLRERRLDISAALGHALAKLRRQRPQANPIMGMTSTAYRMLFCHNWPGNLRQLENTVAKLCEYTDMRDHELIDEVAVAHVFDSRLSGTAATIGEVLAQASLKLARYALSKKPEDIETSIERFRAEIRSSALESTGGDIIKAAHLIGENEHLLELFSQSAYAQKEIELIEASQSN